MKNKFQSLTEKGRWLLATLTLIFTLGIGQMWGDAASWMNNSMTPAAYFTLGSNTSAAANAKTISDVNYTHSINMTSASNQSSNKTNGYFISFTLTSASNVSVLFGANGGGRNLRINTGWSYDEKTNATQLANGATPSNGIKITSDQVANGKYGTVGIDNLAAGTYYICGNGSVSIYKITISNAGGGNTDTEAPAFVSSVPADGAEDVAVEGTIVLAFDEDIASVDASKFTLTGATKGTVAVDGTDAKKVNVAYSNAENSATVKLETAAEAVADAAGNKSVALDDISFTTEAASTGGEEPADNCSKIFAFANTADVPTGITNSTSTFTGFSTGGNNCTGEITIDGTKYTISKRGGNSTFSMTFSVPSGKVGTLYGLANSSGSSARTLTLTGPNDYSQQQSTSAASGSAAAITFTDMPAGAYTLAASGGASTPMLCLKLCDVPKYTVTINPNGGSYASAPEGWTLSAGVYTKEVEGGNFSAPAGLAKGTDDLSWKDNKGNDIEFPVVIDKDTTFIAQWAAHATSSNANLSALSVAGCELNETFAAATTAYTIDLPFYASMPAASAVSATKADANASDPVVSIEGNVISIVVTPESGAADKKTYTITVNIAAAPAASSSINIEQGVLDHGKGWGYAAALSDAHIAIVDADALDSINESKDYRNEPFLGLKFKKATSQFTIVVPASTELKVKFGSINSDAGLKVSVNGSTPAAPSVTSGVYTLAASAGVKEVVFTLAAADKTVVLKQIMINEDIKAVTLPLKVSFDVVGHANAVSPMIWKGSALTLPGVSNIESGYAFEKWNDGSNDYLEGAEYTPTNNVTLTAVYSMTVEDRMAELEFNGVAIAGFSPDVQIYNMTVPYAESLPQITKAVAVDAASGATATIQETYWDNDNNYYVAQAYVIPAGGTSSDAKFYQVRFTMDPKLGATIFKAELTSETDATYSGLYADKDNSEIKLSDDGANGYKFAGKSNYIKMAITDATFAEGDMLKMTYTTNPTQGELAIYEGTTKLQGTAYSNHTLTFSDAADGKSTLFIRRTNDNTFNGWVAAVEVQRYMNPVIKSFKIGDKVGVFSVQNEKNIIDVEVAWNADVTSLTPTIEAYANGGATLDKTGAQNFSDTVEYNVSSAYAGDGSTKYYVVVTKEPHYVVKIGTMSYTSLEAALEHAADGEIVLLEDLDVTAQVEVATGVTATIDLAGHKIEYTGTETLPSGVILVHNGASLTINDSSVPDAGKIIAGEKAYAAIAMTKAGDNAANKAILVINGGIFTGNYYAITGHGSRHNTEITINNGTFNATAFEDNNAIYHPQEGTLTINNGTFTGYLSAIEMRAGTLVINGGTFISTATTYSCNPNGSGTTTVGAAIAIAQHNTQKDIAVTINGGTFTGVKAINEANPQGNADPEVEMAIKGGDFVGEVSTVDVNHFVSGGTFKYEVAEAQCANGYMPSPQDPGTGKYGVLPKDPMCLIKVELSAPDDNTVATPTITVGYGNTEVGGNVKGAKTHETIVGYKFNADGAYLYVTLANGSFQAGDSVEVYMTSGAKALAVYPHMSSAALATSAASASAANGKNYVVLAEGADTLYIARKDDNGWNPYVAYMAVYRSANPILQKFEMAGAAGVINEAAKTVAIEVPYATDVTALTPTMINYVSNGDPVAPAVAVSPAGAQNFTSPVVYTIMDKDGSATSYTVTVSIAEPSTDATLSALSYGGTAIALEDGVYDYVVNLAKGTTVVPALAATAHSAVAQTPVIDNATEFVNYQATSSVVVTAQDGTTTQTYTVLFKVAHMITDLVDVTENTTWDWSLVTKKADGTTISGDGPIVDENSENAKIIANYLLGDNFDKIEGNHAAYAIRNSTDKKVYQGKSLHFHSTKGGYLTIRVAHEGTAQKLRVENAGRDMLIAQLTGDQTEYKVYVQAGDVRVYNAPDDPEKANKPYRLSKLVFTVDETPDYSRDVTNNIGTLCVDHNVLVGGAMGATFYQIASRNELYNYKIDFEEVLPNEELKAGEPYIFQSTTGRIDLFYGATAVTEPEAVRGMHGWFDAAAPIDPTKYDMLGITEENKSDILYIAQNKLWNCEDLVTDDLKVVNNRAYIVMSEVPTYEQYTATPSAGAPRRRVTLGKDEAQVVTGFGELETSETPVKVLINGQIFIIRGEKMFDVTGKLVK